MTHLPDGNWAIEAGTGYGQCIKFKEKLFEKQTPFQKIEIFETCELGRLLMLDGIIQLTSYDEFAYQEMMAHLPYYAHGNPEKVLVIGGGDGGVLRELARHPGIKSLDICEIDADVIDAARKYLPELSCGYDDPRVKINVADGSKFIQEKPEYYDLIISDIMMPIMDGYELVNTLRESGSTTPILMITAKDAFDDMRRGFISGVDDYMIKPVNVNEMALRVGALLRRAQMINDRRLTIGKTVLECDSLTAITKDGTSVLPQKEFMLLYKMASFPGRIFTRQQMMDEIWGYDTESDTHTVDVHIGRLRDRFRDSEDFKIVTMRGVGYKVVKL